MTLPKEKKFCPEEINSSEKAIKDSGIRAVHPDKMEDYAEHLVRKLKEPKNNKPD